MPAGVKANAVEEHLKGLTADPEKATDEQKKEAEEGAVKEITDLMVLEKLAEDQGVQVFQNEVFQMLAQIAQQYGMDPQRFITAIAQNGQLPSAAQEVARSKGLQAGMKAVTFKDKAGEVVDLSAFLGEEESEEDSVAAATAAAEVADEVANADEKPAENAE